MTLDDQLRAALHGRAATLPPSPDPLAGIERRARGLRRRRVAAAVAGTALAVLAVVGAVPLLTPDRTAAPGPADLATSAPSPSPAATSAYAYDPDDPWEYRGVDLPDRERDTLLAEWQAVHPGGTVTPLFGQVWEPAQRLEVLFVDPRSDLYGYASAGEGGWTFRELALPEQPRALALTLGGDETLRFLVVADPRLRVDYAADGERFSPAAALAPGVATGAVEQPEGAFDLYQVVADDGELVAQGPVADEPAPASAPQVEPAGAPSNVVDWEPRGTVGSDVVLAARRAYAASRGADPGQVLEKVLFAGDDDAGRRFLLGQFWLEGDGLRGVPADTVGVVLWPDREPELQLYRPAERDVDVLALHLAPPNEQSRGELVVVPRPGTGQVLYAGDDASEWEPKDTPGLDGVVLLERSPQAERGEAVDRIRLLDGDGVQFAEVVVPDLLCGKTSCS